MRFVDDQQQSVFAVVLILARWFQPIQQRQPQLALVQTAKRQTQLVENRLQQCQPRRQAAAGQIGNQETPGEFLDQQLAQQRLAGTRGAHHQRRASSAVDRTGQRLASMLDDCGRKVAGRVGLGDKWPAAKIEKVFVHPAVFPVVFFAQLPR